VAIFIVDRQDPLPSWMTKARLYGEERSIYHQVFDTLADLEEFTARVKDPANSWPATAIVNGSGVIVGESAKAMPVLLGYYYINPSEPSEIEINDARVRGGGLAGKSFEEYLAENRHVAGYNDIGWYDGAPFGQMTVVVDVPEYLKDTMDEKRIVKELKAHAPVGSMLLVNYYPGIEVNGETVWPRPN
jgi:hypothetical protein